MTRRSITAKDLYHFRWVADAQVSPDGLHIVYVVKSIEHETNTYHSALWMASVTGGFNTAYQFSNDGHSPRWSPDGSMIAFISDRAGPLPEPSKDESHDERDKRCGKGKAQIWRIPFAGGEAQQLTFARWGVDAPLWSPEGTRILFTAQTGDIPEMPEHDGKPEPRARRITNVLYRFNGIGYTYELRTHLFVISSAGGEARQLTDGDWDDTAASWSPDGKSIAFASNRAEDRWMNPGGDIWQITEDGSNPHVILAGGEEMAYGSPSWSPDGQQLACLGEKKWGSDGFVDVFVFTPGMPPRCLTTGHYVYFGDLIGSDMRTDHGDGTPRWSPDGQRLFVLTNARGAGNVGTLNVGDGAFSLETSGQHHVLGYSVDRAGNTFALAKADTGQPGDIFVHWHDSGDTLRLTDVNADLLSAVHVSLPEQFSFTGAQDWEMEGWIIRPPDFDPALRYPLILEIHGGPQTSYGYTFFHEFQLLAAQGYVVAYTNIRGSTGYGREFSGAVRGIWGEQDYEDLMAAINTLLEREPIDPERMGVIGGSYGGFMTNWIIGHTQRFRAAVTDRSVTNLTSEFGTSDVGPWLSKENWWADPWEDRERYAFHSPITYVKQMHTPLLIIHSEEDWRCPIEQAEQLFMSLKWLGREVEFIRFEKQNHELSRSGHPRLRVERLDAIVDWFVRHIPTGGVNVAAANGHVAEEQQAIAPQSAE